MTENAYKPPSSELENTLVYCRDCGSQISKSATECVSCGKPQSINNKSKVAAGLLAFFIGGLGIHRFYLGQWWGIFYLLFFWTWIPSIVSLIEAIVFFCTSQENWQRKHGHRKGGSAWIAILVCFFVIIPFIGILAAVAIPAYQDYKTQSEQAQQQLEK
jgi:TM2 domain-containing membrane protein YozV